MKRLLILACLVVGCGSSGSGPAATSAGATGGGGAGVESDGSAGAWPDLCAVSPAATPVEDVSGKWAYLEVQSSLVQAPAYAEPFSNLVISLILLDQTQTGTSITGQGSFCDRWTYCPTAPTALPDALLSHLPVFSYEGSYGADGSFGFGPVYLVLGATLADPTDPSTLPTSADDPRVVDLDQDGNPGITVVLIKPVPGKIFSAQWIRMKPQGVTSAPDRIEGLLDFSSQQSVLGSDPALIAQMSPTSSPDRQACHSTFRMVRVADGTDCATLRAEELTLFPDLAATPRDNP